MATGKIIGHGDGDGDGDGDATEDKGLKIMSNRTTMTLMSMLIMMM